MGIRCLFFGDEKAISYKLPINKRGMIGTIIYGHLYTELGPILGVVVYRMPSHAARRFSDNVHNIISLNHIVLCYKGFVVPASGNWGVFCRDQPGFTRIPKSCFKFGPYGQVRCWHDCNFSAFSDETSLFSIHYHFTYSHVCV